MVSDRAAIREGRGRDDERDGQAGHIRQQRARDACTSRDDDGHGVSPRWPRRQMVEVWRRRRIPQEPHSHLPAVPL